MTHHRDQIVKFFVLPLLFLLTAWLCLAMAPAQSTLPAAQPAAACSSPACRTVLLADASWMQQGKILYDAGNFEAAIVWLKQAAENYRAQRDSLRQAIVLSNLALANQQLGRWQDAQAAITASLNLLNGAAGQEIQTSLAQVLEIQGDLQLETGQAELAIATWQRAEKLYQQLHEPNGIAQSRINQAQALRVLGFYRRAVATLTDLHQTWQNQPDSLTKVVGLRSLGNALRLVGDLNQSRTVLQQSWEMADRLQSAPEMASEMSAIQ